MKLRLVAIASSAASYYKDHGYFHQGDSGLDLFCVEDQMIPAKSTGFVSMGVKGALYTDSGKNVSWWIVPRSSISRTPLRLVNSIGLIDAGYRGELKSCFDNISDEDYLIKAGVRLVQAVAMNGEYIDLQLVDSLDETSRGSGGYGSTGLRGKGSYAEDEPSTEVTGGRARG